MLIATALADTDPLQPFSSFGESGGAGHDHNHWRLLAGSHSQQTHAPYYEVASARIPA